MSLCDFSGQRRILGLPGSGSERTSFQDATGLVAASTVPEPSVAALLLGLAGMAAHRMRRRRG